MEKLQKYYNSIFILIIQFNKLFKILFKFAKIGLFKNLDNPPNIFVKKEMISNLSRNYFYYFQSDHS